MGVCGWFKSNLNSIVQLCSLGSWHCLYSKGNIFSSIYCILRSINTCDLWSRVDIVKVKVHLLINMWSVSPNYRCKQACESILTHASLRALTKMILKIIPGTKISPWEKNVNHLLALEEKLPQNL